MAFLKHKKRRLVGLLAFTVMLLAAVISVNAEEPKAAKGVTYYVSASAGNDKNSGTSEKEAWKSLTKLNNLKLGPGDSVLLMKGDRWVGEYIRLNAPTGEEGNPVTLGTYGDGEKPQLAGHDNEVPDYDDVPVIQIKNGEHIVIDGLDVGFCGVGLDLYYEMETNKQNVRVQNCHFHDIYGFSQVDKANIAMYSHATGIVVTGVVPIPGNLEPLLEGLYIDNCSSYNAGALYTYGQRIGSVGYLVEGLYVTDCVMENNGIYGIAVCNMDGGYMDNCKIIDCGSHYCSFGSMGIMITGDNFTIMNCEIAYTQRLYDGADGGGIDFEHYTYDTDVINCYFHDNSGVGVMMYQSHSDATHQNKRIRFIGNVFENNNLNPYSVGGAELISYPNTSLVDGQIFNNKYMVSDNAFASAMDPTVDIRGNTSYTSEQQGKVWPIYDFDDVRAYVIDGVPLPSLEREVTEEEVVYGWICNNGSYFVGAALGLVLLLLVLIVVNIVKSKKKVPVVATLMAMLLFMLVPANDCLAANNGLKNPNGTANNGVYRLSKMCKEDNEYWDYYWMDTQNERVPLLRDADGVWRGDSTCQYAVISSTTWHPHSAGYTLATFTCPDSGRIRIGSEVPLVLTQAANTQDGIVFVAMSDEEVLGEIIRLTKENPTKEFETVELDVYKGQEICFYLSHYYTNAGDSTQLQPFVEYVEYKEVDQPIKDNNEEEKNSRMKNILSDETVRTDIEPIEIREEAEFVLKPSQLVIGSIPILLVGIIGIFLATKRRAKKKE